MSTISSSLVKTFSNGNSTTYALSDWNTLTYPAVVIQKRKVPTGKQVMTETSIDIILGTHDADGILLTQKVRIGVSAAMPVTGQGSDMDAAIATVRDIIASTEWADAVKKQLPLK